MYSWFRFEQGIGMTFFNSPAFLLLLGSLAFPFVPQSAEQKPVETSEAVVNYAAPPATLEGLAQLSSAVIVGRIAGADAQAEWENRGYARIFFFSIGIRRKPPSRFAPVQTERIESRMGFWSLMVGRQLPISRRGAG
jgi:hypothetical protein